MDRWRNKISVVTGASSGIGTSICRKLTENGITVIGLARRIELVEKLAQEINQNGGKMYAIKCDVSKIEEIQNVFKFIKVTYGPVQILINNAGYLKNETITDGDPEELKKTLDTNLLGTTICAKETIAQIREQNLEGHIINMNSIMGHGFISVPNPAFNVYPSTKFGISILCKTLAHEVRHYKAKIKVTSISPGLVGQTDIFNSALMTEFNDDVVKSMPHLLPEDVADGVIYVLGTPPHVQVAELTLKATEEFF